MESDTWLPHLRRLQARRFAAHPPDFCRRGGFFCRFLRFLQFSLSDCPFYRYAVPLILSMISLLRICLCLIVISDLLSGYLDEDFVVTILV